MEYEKAKKFAAKLVAFKMYSCKEVYQKLIQKGFSSEVSERVINDFSMAGILDDEEYAKLFIHDGLFVNLKGIFRIKQELIQKGVASSLIEKTIKEIEVDTNAQLDEYVRIRFGDKVFYDWKELEKAKSHLVRRGFGIYEINKSFERLGIKITGRDAE